MQCDHTIPPMNPNDFCKPTKRQKRANDYMRKTYRFNLRRMSRLVQRGQW